MRRLAVLVTASVLLAAAACSSGEVRDVTDDTTTTTLVGVPGPASAGPGFQPRFVPASCVDGVPRDARVRCGWLVTREDRTKASGPTVRLPVAIISPEGSASPPADPVVYLAGGPGASGLAGVEGFLDEGYQGNREVIAFDQRGTGSAKPSLDCPEVESAVRATFATADPATEERKVIGAGFAACHDRLVADDVDLASFRTETSADDVDDLRAALGYDTVDLYGASYGTALALTVMRRHPRGIRSVTLDAVYPTTVANGPGEIAANARRALDALAAGCAAAPACHAAVPDVAAAITKVVDTYTAAPHRGSFADATSGQRVDVTITGPDVVAGIVQAMYQPASITALPAALQALATDPTGIDDSVAAGINGLTSLSEGMAASVECADRARARSSATLAEVAASDPAMTTLALIGDFTAVCPIWDVPPATEAFSTPVRSAIPTLVLDGAYDPVTPPSNGSVAAASLSRAHQVTFATGGHGAVFALPCAQQVFRAFLALPTAAPSVTCAGTPASPWVD